MISSALDHWEQNAIDFDGVDGNRLRGFPAEPIVLITCRGAQAILWPAIVNSVASNETAFRTRAAPTGV